MTRAVIRATDDDGLLADFYGRHWTDMGEAAALPDWRDRALAFIAARRRDAGLTGFLLSIADRPAGGALCHRLARPFPAFRPEDEGEAGYIWGVYVAPDQRGRGYGAALVGRCADHLLASGCGRVLLHAGDGSAPLYARLGFASTGEMGQTLKRNSITSPSLTT